MTVTVTMIYGKATSPFRLIKACPVLLCPVLMSKNIMS
jgi:hypothetical protein